jgi:hypothetical protein
MGCKRPGKAERITLVEDRERRDGWLAAAVESGFSLAEQEVFE